MVSGAVYNKAIHSIYTYTMEYNEANHNDVSRCPTNGISWHVCPSKTDQPAHLCSLISLCWALFAKPKVQHFSGRKLWFWSDCADVKTGLNIHCMHILSCTLCWKPTLTFTFQKIDMISICTFSYTNVEDDGVWGGSIGRPSESNLEGSWSYFSSGLGGRFS